MNNVYEGFTHSLGCYSDSWILFFLLETGKHEIMTDELRWGEGGLQRPGPLTWAVGSAQCDAALATKRHTRAARGSSALSCLQLPARVPLPLGWQGELFSESPLHFPQCCCSHCSLSCLRLTERFSGGMASASCAPDTGCLCPQNHTEALAPRSGARGLTGRQGLCRQAHQTALIQHDCVLRQGGHLNADTDTQRGDLGRPREKTSICQPRRPTRIRTDSPSQPQEDPPGPTPWPRTPGPQPVRRQVSTAEANPFCGAASQQPRESTTAPLPKGLGKKCVAPLS